MFRRLHRVDLTLDNLDDTFSRLLGISHLGSGLILDVCRSVAGEASNVLGILGSICIGN